MNLNLRNIAPSNTKNKRAGIALTPTRAGGGGRGGGLQIAATSRVFYLAPIRVAADLLLLSLQNTCTSTVLRPLLVPLLLVLLPLPRLHLLLLLRRRRRAALGATPGSFLYLWISDEGSRDGHPLFLSPTKAGPSLPHKRVVAIRQTVNKTDTTHQYQQRADARRGGGEGLDGLWFGYSWFSCSSGSRLGRPIAWGTLISGFVSGLGEELALSVV